MDAWRQWIEHSKMIVNEYRIDLASPQGQKLMLEQAEKYFFGEGAQMPPDYVPPAGEVAARARRVRQCARPATSCWSRATSRATSRSRSRRRPRFCAPPATRRCAIDLAVEELDGPRLERLARARLVAISAPMHTAMSLGLRVARRVRAINPRRARLLLRALRRAQSRAAAAAARRRWRRAQPLADTVFGAECEEDLVALAQRAGDGRDAASPAPAARARCTACRSWFPIAALLPSLDRYARLIVGDERRVAGHVEATRGCKYLCRHCPIPPVYHGRFFAVPIDIVLEDARRQIAAGARHITFGDPDFLNSAKHALAAARGLHAAHPDVTFSFTAKVEHIVAERAIFPELAALGCVFVVSAVESLSDEILALLDKGHTRADVVEALAIVRGAGISLRPTFVAFTPFTSIDDYLMLCRFIRENDLEQEVDPIQLAIRLLIPPGSLLLETARARALPRRARRGGTDPPLAPPGSAHGCTGGGGVRAGRAGDPRRRAAERDVRAHPRAGRARRRRARPARDA